MRAKARELVRRLNLFDPAMSLSFFRALAHHKPFPVPYEFRKYWVTQVDSRGLPGWRNKKTQQESWQDPTLHFVQYSEEDY